jgi:DNA replication protein DnaC
MLFMGQTGLGKTFLSSCIAKAIAEKGYAVAFGSISDFLREIENEHFGRTEGNTLDALLNADIVILDDLGSEFSGTFYESTIYNIINGRINLKKPTIISTNLTQSQLNLRYNERISSRVFNEFMPIMFVGKDIRQKKASKLFGGK